MEKEKLGKKKEEGEYPTPELLQRKKREKSSRKKKHCNKMFQGKKIFIKPLRKGEEK